MYTYLHQIALGSVTPLIQPPSNQATIGVDTKVTIGVSTFYRHDTSAIWLDSECIVERTSSLCLTGCNIELYAPRGVEMALE